MTTATILTTQEVADALGISARRVRALARSRHLGTLLPNHTLVFTAADVDAMRERPSGRPKRSPHNLHL